MLAFINMTSCHISVYVHIKIHVMHAYSKKKPHSSTHNTPHAESPKHTPWLCATVCSLLTCVEPPVCGTRAACHCLSSVMDVPFVAHRYTERPTDSGGTQLGCPVQPRMSSSSV